MFVKTVKQKDKWLRVCERIASKYLGHSLHTIVIFSSYRVNTEIKNVILYREVAWVQRCSQIIYKMRHKRSTALFLKNVSHPPSEYHWFIFLLSREITETVDGNSVLKRLAGGSHSLICVRGNWSRNRPSQSSTLNEFSTLRLALCIMMKSLMSDQRKLITATAPLRQMFSLTSLFSRFVAFNKIFVSAQQVWFFFFYQRREKVISWTASSHSCTLTDLTAFRFITFITVSNLHSKHDFLC